MPWKNIQLPLSSDEIRQILENCGEDAILIGGQALARASTMSRDSSMRQTDRRCSARVGAVGLPGPSASPSKPLERHPQHTPPTLNNHIPLPRHLAQHVLCIKPRRSHLSGVKPVIPPRPRRDEQSPR